MKRGRTEEVRQAEGEAVKQIETERKREQTQKERENGAFVGERAGLVIGLERANWGEGERGGKSGLGMVEVGVER